MRTALIDADIAIYRAAVLTENDDYDQCKTLMKDIVRSWVDWSESTDYILFCSGYAPYRRKWWPDYKGHRKDKPQPRWRSDLFNLTLTGEFGHVVKHDEAEADDLIGMSVGHDTVIVTVDKDLQQIAGLHYNPDKQKITVVDEDLAEYNMYLQILTGDSTDNYPGLKGIGDRKAAQILDDSEGYDRFKVCKQAYLDRDYSLDYLESMIVCAVIQQQELPCLDVHQSGVTIVPSIPGLSQLCKTSLNG